MSTVKYLYILLSRCFEAGEYRQALGIAIETKRLDIFERAITCDTKTESQVEMDT